MGYLSFFGEAIFEAGIRLLNDYGRQLTKHLTVQNVLLALVVIFVIGLWNPQSVELANWVQAIGSIVAIMSGFLLLAHKERAREKERLSVLYFAIRQLFERTSYMAHFQKNGRHISELSSVVRPALADSYSLLSSMSLSDLSITSSPGVISNYFDARQALFELSTRLSETVESNIDQDMLADLCSLAGQAANQAKAVMDYCERGLNSFDG